MKNHAQNPLVTLMLWLGIIALTAPVSTIYAQGTAFTYQGRLNSTGTPVNGSYDFQFIAYDNNVGGSQQGSIVSTNAVPVTNGSFTVTMDFGPIFTGAARWLEISVKTNGAATYTVLSPRQALMPVPYAMYSAYASSAGTAASVSGPLSGDVTGTQTGTAVSKVGGQTAADVASGTAVANAATSANTANTIVKRDEAGDFAAGTVTATAFSGNGASLTSLNASQLSSGMVSPTVLPSFQAPSYATTGGGQGNSATASYATVGGGYLNGATNIFATIAGGQLNTAGSESTIGGGNHNAAPADTATVAGGGYNVASGNRSSVGGGVGNEATSDYATVPGGSANVASGSYSFAAGRNAQAMHQGSFVWADSQSATFGSTSNDQFNVRADGGVRFVTGGAGMTLDGLPVITSGYEDVNLGSYSSLPGGWFNTIQSGADRSTISGGNGNVVAPAIGATIGGGVANRIGTNATCATIAGGNFNTVLNSAGQAAIGGGLFNTNGGFAATVPGGYLNLASGDYSLAAGDNARAVNTGAFVWSDSRGTSFSSAANDQFLARARGGIGLDTASTPEGDFCVNTNSYIFSHVTSSLSLIGSEGNYKPATGYFVITAYVEGDFNGNLIYLFLYDVSDPNNPVQLTLSSGRGTSGGGYVGGHVALSWVVPITSAGGYENFALYASTDSGDSYMYHHNLTVMYFPRANN